MYLCCHIYLKNVLVKEPCSVIPLYFIPRGFREFNYYFIIDGSVEFSKCRLHVLLFDVNYIFST